MFGNQTPMGVIEHILKELDELKETPYSLEEWCDVILLAFDGAWRAGYTAEQIIEMLQHKQVVNISRQWTKPANENVAVEHER